MTRVWEGFHPNLFGARASDLAETAALLPNPMADLGESLSKILEERTARQQQGIENTREAELARLKEMLTAGQLEAMGVDSSKTLQEMDFMRKDGAL